MKKTIAVLLILMTLAPRAGAVNWTYQGDEWPLPKSVYTERDYQKYVTARKWFLFAGSALMLGAVIANKNAVGLNAKSRGVPVSLTQHQTILPGGGIAFTTSADPAALEARGRIRSKAQAYRTGAAIGAVMASFCLSVAYSMRF